MSNAIYFLTITGDVRKFSLHNQSMKRKLFGEHASDGRCFINPDRYLKPGEHIQASKRVYIHDVHTFFTKQTLSPVRQNIAKC